MRHLCRNLNYSVWQQKKGWTEDGWQEIIPLLWRTICTESLGEILDCRALCSALFSMEIPKLSACSRRGMCSRPHKFSTEIRAPSSNLRLLLRWSKPSQMLGVLHQKIPRHVSNATVWLLSRRNEVVFLWVWTVAEQQQQNHTCSAFL